ncbi:craniofacial development protein 2-like protein [Plakobranchus ocellatus]|uniref:Craniofacial development protein 2-like protein n=1 Tax=Plakobranchus ocellatus TaxID=259542 RepID=A0AAV4D796_9GAST|nr:craniofacial development protein 2-like protein [Plakobranchus ocellatus]
MAPGRHPASALKINLDQISKRKKFNVRTLDQKEKLENVIEEMDRIELNILGLAEVRWTGASAMKLGNKNLIYSGGHTRERGGGILFNAQRQKVWELYPISDRVVVAKLITKPLHLGIIQVYAPTSDNEDVEVEKFYEEIEKAKVYPKSQDIIIVMGDFNAKVGDGRDERVEDVVGPSGIGNVNERGSRLIEWCEIDDFTIKNTWYQNHPWRQWTWKSPIDRSRNKIDYILTQKRFRNAVKTSKSLPGADCDSDHIPLAGCKSVRHKSDENSRAGLSLALSSHMTGMPASCEDDGCRHPAGSPAHVASPSPNATIGDRTSPCLFHTLEDPHTASISSTDRLQLPTFPSP